MFTLTLVNILIGRSRSIKIKRIVTYKKSIPVSIDIPWREYITTGGKI